MKKVVINACHGGFGLSEKALFRYAELAGINLIGELSSFTTLYYRDEVKDENIFRENQIDRDDPHLIQVVEELGNEASGNFAKLKIVEIPEDVQWEIEEYDGWEWVAEVHRTWS
jgi:hypothetical protein